jgi:hypothetical protein
MWKVEKHNYHACGPIPQILYECYGLFLRHQEVNIEATYPWFVRYTENIQRDAPSQSHEYVRVANESVNRDITIEEIVRWHKETCPISEQLLKDIQPVGTPSNGRRQDDRSVSTTGASNTPLKYPFENNSDYRYIYTYWCIKSPLIMMSKQHSLPSWRCCWRWQDRAICQQKVRNAHTAQYLW